LWYWLERAGIEEAMTLASEVEWWINKGQVWSSGKALYSLHCFDIDGWLAGRTTDP